MGSGRRDRTFDQSLTLTLSLLKGADYIILVIHLWTLRDEGLPICPVADSTPKKDSLYTLPSTSLKIYFEFSSKGSARDCPHMWGSPNSPRFRPSFHLEAA